MINTYIWLTWILLLIGPPLFCQETLQEQYEYSVNLYNQEKYFDAVTELKRLNFFDKGKEYAFQSNLLIGKAYKEGGKFSDALKYFTLAEISTVHDSDVFMAKIYAVRTNILRRTTWQAHRLLDQLQGDKRFKDRLKKIIYWRGWAYIFADDWDNAAEKFAEINNDSLKILCENVSARKYSLTTAKILSYIVPGAGQFYTGHYFSGILSLGWNFLWGYLAVKAFVDQRIFDGFMIGNFLWLRFYVGNLQDAEKFAVDENLKISNSALSYLQYQYKGEKP
jgi:hypothetical protein